MSRESRIRSAICPVVSVGMPLYTVLSNLSPSHQPDARAPDAPTGTHEARDLGDKAAGKLRSEHTAWTIQNPPHRTHPRPKTPPPQTHRTAPPRTVPQRTEPPPPQRPHGASLLLPHQVASTTRSPSSTRKSRKTSRRSPRNSTRNAPQDSASRTSSRASCKRRPKRKETSSRRASLRSSKTVSVSCAAAHSSPHPKTCTSARARSVASVSGPATS